MPLFKEHNVQSQCPAITYLTPGFSITVFCFEFFVAFSQNSSAERGVLA
jgi:hypothetical protein